MDADASDEALAVKGDAPVADLRQLLSSREEAGSMFSAAAAGVKPAAAGRNAAEEPT